MRMTPRRLAALIVVMVFAAIAALGDEWRRDAAVRSTAAEYQRLVGGLGLGSELDGSRCWYGFDPRLSPRCSQSRGPLPDGEQYCPSHWASVFYLRPLSATAVAEPEPERPPE